MVSGDLPTMDMVVITEGDIMVRPGEWAMDGDILTTMDTTVSTILIIMDTITDTLILSTITHLITQAIMWPKTEVEETPIITELVFVEERTIHLFGTTRPTAVLSQAEE